MAAKSSPPDMDAWKHAVTRRIFNVTLDSQEAEKSAWTIVFLKDLAAELHEETGAPPRLDPAIADRVLIARLSLDPSLEEASSTSQNDDAVSLTVLASLDEDETSWDWLVACWKRCEAEKVKARKGMGDRAAEAIALIDEAQGLITSYAGLVLITPEMFPSAAKKSGQRLSPLVLVPSILNMAGASASASQSSTSAHWASFDQHEVVIFLSWLATRFEADELEQIIGPSVCEVARRIRDGAQTDDGQTRTATASTSDNAANPEALQAAAQSGDVQTVLAHLLGLNGTGGPHAGGNGARSAQPHARGMHIGDFEWRSHALPIVELVDLNKNIASAISHMSAFNPPDSAASRLELDSALGPIVRLGAFADGAPAVAEQYFSNASTRSREELDSNTRSLRSVLQPLHSLHFRLFQALIKASPASRERVLAYWGTVADLNKRRGAMRVKAGEVCTDAFAVNTWETLQRFAVPFMDSGYSKMDRIDTEYLRHQSRFDASSLTRLNASESEAQRWADDAPPGAAAPNFITEVFFLVVRMTNLGPGKAIRSYGEKEEDIRRIKKRIKETEETRGTWSSTPQAAQYEAFIKQAQSQADKLTAQTHAAATQLLDDDFVDRLIHLISFTMTWLVRVADPTGKHPHQVVSLPLPQDVPVPFSMLPEHIFEDICDILLFLARHKPTSLPEHAKKDFVTFTVTFLSSGWYIKNPFIKAKLAEIMWWNVIPYGYSQTGILGDIINVHPLALAHLVPACMSFWVEAESTGSHTQFYDKFNIRYHLSQIFKVIWNNPKHQERIQAEAKGNSEKFVVFINRLMNDVTYLLDDAFEKLLELHRKQQEIDDTATWNERSPEERTETESHVQSIQGQIRNMLDFGNEFLRLLIDFTARTKDAFMTPEIVSRLAAMLDYNLDLLVGPRCTELRVKDPARVHFEPRHLLRQILSVYLNLASRDEFVKAIAADGRSYRKEIFHKACGVAEKYILKSPVELEELGDMVSRVERVLQEEREEEEDLGEIPDDYCDPLMATLMRNPVRLPTSGAVVDMSTIKSHLLSDASDPFNRSPLKLEDVKPADELRQEIEAWVKQRKAARQERLADAEMQGV
ncbi:unnamed protein product [Parajaminaea phylloscopi]